MGDILIKAESEEQLEEFAGMLSGLMNFAGGWAGSYGEDDPLGDVEIRMMAHSASDQELTAIWQRMRAGEAPGDAHRAVAGPSYQLRERRRREYEKVRPRPAVHWLTVDAMRYSVMCNRSGGYPKRARL